MTTNVSRKLKTVTIFCARIVRFLDKSVLLFNSFFTYFNPRKKTSKLLQLYDLFWLIIFWWPIVNKNKFFIVLHKIFRRKIKRIRASHIIVLIKQYVSIRYSNCHSHFWAIFQNIIDNEFKRWWILISMKIDQAWHYLF